MIDIVERLRFLAAGQDDLHSVELACAADEIERLREIVKWFACNCEGACDRSADDCLISQAALGEKE